MNKDAMCRFTGDATITQASGHKSHADEKTSIVKQAIDYLLDLPHKFLPVFFDKREAAKRTPHQTLTSDIQHYVVHIDNELANARTSYCNSLIEISKYRVEAQTQIVRAAELERIRVMILNSQTKSVETLRSELESFNGQN